MDEHFASNVRKVRLRVGFFALVFFAAAGGLFADAFYLERAASPGVVATFGFAALFAVLMGTWPVFMYVMPRMTSRLRVERCPACSEELWNGGLIVYTVVLARCPACKASLRDTQGFDVEPSDKRSTD